MYVADLGMYYVHGRWWRTDLGIFLSPAEETGEYRYGSGQDGINEVWTQLLSGATYQILKNNADAVSPLLYLRPGAHDMYDEVVVSIEDTLPSNYAYRAGRLFGATVTVVQGVSEAFAGPGIAAGGTVGGCLATGIETAGIGCLASAGVSVVAGGAVLVHGLSVEYHSIRNGVNILMARGRGSDRFSRLLDDFVSNPQKWDLIQRDIQPSTRKGGRVSGQSIQEVYQNSQTGDVLVRHIVTDDKGKIVEDHFRLDFKP